MKWNYKELNEIKYKKLQKIDNVSDILAKVLTNRDVEPEYLDALVNSPAEKFMQMQKDFPISDELTNAANKIKEYALKEDVEIWIFADYDTDGLTSGYIMTDFLRKVTNNKVYVYFPEKQDGYGLSIPFCKDLIDYKNDQQKQDNTILVVTVDNGTSCITEVDLLKKNGIEVVITDHHQPKEKLPKCIIYNPQIYKDSNAGKELAGCGVAFKVIHEVERLMDIEEYSVTSHYTPYVAIGTIADMMPMTGENPFFIRVGFNTIAYSKDDFTALIKWKDELGIERDTFVPKDISWTIAPRLNSCGRMGNILQGASMMFAIDEDTAGEIASTIEKINKDRKDCTGKAFKVIQKFDCDYTDKAICVFDCTDYSAGIAGGLANKMLETYGKPSFVYSIIDDNCVGSARSNGDFPLTDLMERELLNKNILTYGGHKQACGFKFETSKAEALFNSIDEAIRSASVVVEQEEPVLEIDACITLDDMNQEVYEQLANYVFNGEPSLVLKNLSVISVKYSKNNPKNICLKVGHGKYGLDIWAWGMADLYKELGSPTTIDMAGNVDANFMSFGSTNKYTMRVIDFKKSE